MITRAKSNPKTTKQRGIQPLADSNLVVLPALLALQSDIASCTVCPSLKPWRKFGPEVYGHASTGYLLVGEAPGYVSWRKRRRFTGQAGMLIRRALWAVGHPRYRDLEDLFYMTDIVKCHPAASANPSSNRSPRRVEVEACSSYLLRELQVLRPSAIVTFGKAAAESVTRAIKQATEPVESSCLTGQAGDRSSASRCMGQTEVIPFPHPSPRNQVTILKQYPSMRAFEEVIARTFRQLIARLEAPKGREA